MRIRRASTPCARVSRKPPARLRRWTSSLRSLASPSSGATSARRLPKKSWRRTIRADAQPCARSIARHATPRHFWFAANTARWGQTKGILRSLFLLSTIQEEIRTVIALDPGFTAVYALAGNVYYEVPGVFGGNLDLAE